ncbi:MAG: hypothetical protein EA374_00935 [Acholeplasmatales bacterium]|nr:MAG: hypothetical protein EA374_00935 [Acholeplasmatales bacterium]
MRHQLQQFWRVLTVNFKTLLAFELGYRILGVLVIVPLARLMFYLSIAWYGMPYITQSMLLSYLMRPTTVLLIIVLLIVLMLYLMFEMTVLACLFSHSHQGHVIRLKPLLLFVFNDIRHRKNRRPLRIAIAALSFFLSVELLHLVGMASTLRLPLELSEAVNTRRLWQLGFYAGIALLMVVTIKTFFTMHNLLAHGQTVQAAKTNQRHTLRNQRLSIVLAWLLLNFVLNLLLYAVYALVAGLLALLIFMTRGQAYILGVLLTALYTFYIIATWLASLILVPVNYAWLMTRYYDLKQQNGQPIELPNIRDVRTRTIDKIWLKRALTLFVLGVFFLNVTSVFTALSEPESRLAYVKRPDIVAHRGAALVAPENTLSAIDAAIEMGADIVEFDLHETLDHVPVLMHDARLGRTTNDTENRLVRTVTLDEIKQLDAGSWFSEAFVGEPVPTLEETLAHVQGRTRVFLDLKARSETFNARVVELIEDYDFVEDALVLSFSLDQLKAIKALNPDIQTVLLIATFFGDIQRLINNPNIDHFAFRRTVLQMNPHFVESIHQADKKVYVWAVDDRLHMQRFVVMDVDGLISKDPLIAREVVYGRFTTTRFNALLEALFAPER